MRTCVVLCGVPEVYNSFFLYCLTHENGGCKTLRSIENNTQQQNTTRQNTRRLEASPSPLTEPATLQPWRWLSYVYAVVNIDLFYGWQKVIQHVLCDAKRSLCQGVLSFQNTIQFHGTRTNVFCADAHKEPEAFHFHETRKQSTAFS